MSFAHRTNWNDVTKGADPNLPTRTVGSVSRHAALYNHSLVDDIGG